ncbi:MAG: WW domain-containing oxidoreductase [Halieaceae bacterium]|jgi:WW domain-containing oxidoreductase
MAFNRKSTAEQVTEGVDLKGRTAVITGVNSGLGEETMRVLAMRGAHVIGLARTTEKAEAACSKVDGSATGVACELSDFAAVAACADEIIAMDVPIDILITNAGIMAPAKLSHSHGLEQQFATNHVGHFILVNKLLEQVKRADAGRIVMLSSGAHAMTNKGGIDFDNLDAAKRYSPWRFYGQSKLANLLTARRLARNLEGSGVSVNAVHPGVINTGLARDVGGGLLMGALSLVSPLIAKTVGQGAATQCYVAASPETAGITGKYFVDCKSAPSTRYGRDMKLAERLWLHSVDLTKDYL